MNTAGNAKRARGAILTRGAGNGAKENLGLTAPNCTSIHNHLSSPDYLALMRQAATPAAYLAAFTSFLNEIEVSNG